MKQAKAKDDQGNEIRLAHLARDRPDHTTNARSIFTIGTLSQRQLAARYLPIIST
jgi:hypothetical protein